jgi:hypothetical protein
MRQKMVDSIRLISQREFAALKKLDEDVDIKSTHERERELANVSGCISVIQ